VLSGQLLLGQPAGVIEPVLHYRPGELSARLVEGAAFRLPRSVSDHLLPRGRLMLALA
jgi:hypothetical protein